VETVVITDRTIRHQDIPVFCDAAQYYKCWILVRPVNERSLSYVGVNGYTPKPLGCKAKTADLDAGGKEIAGLVVDPTFHPGAFSNEKAGKAPQFWKKFLKDCGSINAEQLERGRSEYGVDLDPKSKHCGVVTFRGQWIYGDYDLKDVILVGHECRNLAAVEEVGGQPHMRGPKFYAVQDFINRRIGADMVQHAAEAQYAGHSDEDIHVFTPYGDCYTLRGRHAVEAFYDCFDRDVLDTQTPSTQPAHTWVKPLTRDEVRASLRVIPGGRLR